MQEVAQASEQLVEAEAEEGAEDRALDEVEEQMRNWNR